MKENNNLKKLALLGSALYCGGILYKKLTRNKRKEKLKDEVIVITGASSGIGKAYAYEFAKLGSKLVLAARRTEMLEELANELKDKYGTEVLIITTDVAIETSAISMIEKALDHFGKIDILINNAGTATYEYFYKDTTENMRKVMEVNYWGMVYCTHAVLPSMIKAKKGKIVNVSSVAGKISTPGIGNYSATKHAMNALSTAIRGEVSKYGIKVIVICPTSTKTDIVKNSQSSSAFKLDKENYFGMTVEQVAKDTINAIVDNKKELIFGAGEKVINKVNSISPDSIDLAMKYGHRFVFKE